MGYLSRRDFDDRVRLGCVLLVVPDAGPGPGPADPPVTRGNGAAGIIVVGEHADGLELVVAEQVGFVDFSDCPGCKRGSELGFHVACMSVTWRSAGGL